MPATIDCPRCNKPFTRDRDWQERICRDCLYEVFEIVPKDPPRPNPHAVYLVQAWRENEHARFGQECIADANVQGLNAARIKAGSWLAQTYPDASSVRIMDMVADYCEVTERDGKTRRGTFASTTLVSLEDTIL